MNNSDSNSQSNNEYEVIYGLKNKNQGVESKTKDDDRRKNTRVYYK